VGTKPASSTETRGVARLWSNSKTKRIRRGIRSTNRNNCIPQNQATHRKRGGKSREKRRKKKKGLQKPEPSKRGERKQEQKKKKVPREGKTKNQQGERSQLTQRMRAQSGQAKGNTAGTKKRNRSARGWERATGTQQGENQDRSAEKVGTG